MIPSAIVSLSAAALLVKKPQQSTSPLLFTLLVVQSFTQQHNRIEEDLGAQIFSSCCQYVLDKVRRYDDPRFCVNAKDLAAEDTNIQSVLFSGSPSSELSEKTIEAFIALSWHYCDTMPNTEIASRTAEAAQSFRMEKYIVSAVWCLGRTYYNLDNKLMPSYDMLTSFSMPSPLIMSLNNLVANAVSTLSTVPGMSTIRTRLFLWRGT